MPELIDVSHVSRRGSSLRITVPRKVASLLSIKEESIIGFYREGDKVSLSILE